MALADDLKATAAQVKRVRAEAAERQAEANREAYEAKVDAIATEFSAERLRHIEEVLAEKAAAGLPGYTVWRYYQMYNRGAEADGIIEGMRRVQRWLRSQGINAELKHHEENVPDWGYENDWTLTATWGNE